MRRDMNLIKKMLLRVENLSSENLPNDDTVIFEWLDIPGYPIFGDNISGANDTYWIIYYHFSLLVKSGLVLHEQQPGLPLFEGSTPEMETHLSGLTWQGHEYIDAIRDKDFPALYAKPQNTPSPDLP